MHQLRKHGMTVVSAVLIAAISLLALRNDAFEVQTGEEFEAPAVAARAPLPPAPSPTPTPRPPREQALVFLVVDDFHAWQIAGTFSTLVWDTPQSREPYVHFLVAGTPETQSAAIQQLNGLIEAATLHQVDLRVVDLRPDRGVPQTMRRGEKITQTYEE